MAEVLRRPSTSSGCKAQDANVGKMPTSRVNAAELWDRVLDHLKGQMTLATFRSVFGGSRAGFFDGETLDVALVSKSACEWARERLGAVVKRAVADVAGSPVVVRFSTAKGAAKGSEGREMGNGESEGETLRQAQGDTEVRDQRRVRWYRVDNVVLDDYLPFMGVRAFAVYSLYCRMSGRDGLSWPGYSYVCDTLKIGRTTLARCNAVLEALGLIEIERGNQERSNRYYLLEPEMLTFEVVSRIRERAEVMGLDSVVDALDLVLSGDYPSPESGLPQSSTGTTPVLTGDYPSPGPGLEQDISNKTQEEDTGTSNHEGRERTRKGAKSGSSSAGEDTAGPSNAVEMSDNELADWLVELGMGRSLALKLVLQYERDLIVAWVEYIVDQDTIKNPIGFLRSKLKGGGWP